MLTSATPLSCQKCGLPIGNRRVTIGDALHYHPHCCGVEEPRFYPNEAYENSQSQKPNACKTAVYVTEDQVRQIFQEELEKAKPEYDSKESMQDEILALVSVLRAVRQEFNEFGHLMGNGFDSRVFSWVKDALAPYGGE